jgi:hypothetical protein
MKRSLIAILFILICFELHAEGVWYFNFSLRDVRAQNKKGQTSFRTIESTHNPAKCVNTDYYGIRPENNPQLAMSVLLAAYLSRRNIDIYVSNTECDLWGRPSVHDVRIRN